jgi:transcriptional regulator with XRE-family HTH domain
VREDAQEVSMRVGTARELGALVRERRESLGLTQQEAAAEAAVSREWLSRFEAGKSTVPLSRVFDTLAALGLAVDVTEAQDA